MMAASPTRAATLGVTRFLGQPESQALVGRVAADVAARDRPPHRAKKSRRSSQCAARLLVMAPNLVSLTGPPDAES
jgi:hypothetical protein